MVELTVVAKRDDIKKELKRQEDEVYGENTISGSSPDPDSDDDVMTNLEDAVGAGINPGDEFHLADEVMNDESARQPGASVPDPDPDGSEETENEEE